LDPRRRLLISVGSVLLFLVVGTVGYMLIEHQPALISLYMTVITVFTVGFKEVIDLHPSGQVWTMLVIMFGYGTVAIALANLVSLLVGGELRAIRGRLRMNAQIKNLRNHVIICGYGRMGRLIAADLKRDGTPFVVIESSPTKEMEALDILFVAGDATEDSTLVEAGVMAARALVSCLGSDADNVYVTLSARELRADLRIISRAENPTTETKLMRAGADSVICPQIIGANKASALLLRPHVVDFVDMASGGVDIEIAQYDVDPESGLAGAKVRESKIRERAGVTIVAIKRADGSQLFNPGPEEVIGQSDQLILIGRRGLSERISQLGA
jgi:voltage-gated potassium channel